MTKRSSLLQSFPFLFAVRCVVGLFLVRTWFDPDETFQSVEIAHLSVFGFGYRTWEWTPPPLRGWTHPALFAGLFRVLSLLGLGSARAAVVWAPRILQAFFCAWTDLNAGRIVRRWGVGGLEESNWAVGLSLASWFTGFAGARTLANSLETCLVSAAFASWPLPRRGGGGAGVGDVLLPFLFASLAFLVRPTSAIVLALPAAALLSSRPRVIAPGLAIAAAALALGAVIDRVGLGAWTLPVLSFLSYNVGGAGGDYYGVHPWHWYFSNGLPAVVGPMLPVISLGLADVALGWARGLREAGGARLLAATALAPVAVLSLLSHKEFRFLMPVTPALWALGAAPARSLWVSGRGSRLIVGALLLANLPALLFFGLLHQRAPMAASEWLASHSHHIRDVMLLTPCHAMPYHSHLHAPDLALYSLDCSPPGRRPPGHPQTGLDDSDLFRSDPLRFLLDDRHAARLPSPPAQAVVVFSEALDRVMPWLDKHGYHPEHCPGGAPGPFHHTPLDEHRYLYIACRRDDANEP